MSTEQSFYPTIVDQSNGNAIVDAVPEGVDKTYLTFGKVLSEERKKALQSGLVSMESEEEDETALEGAGIFFFSEKNHSLLLGMRTEKKFPYPELEAPSGKAEVKDLEGAKTTLDVAINTAIRETFEESGVVVNPKTLTKTIRLYSVGNTGGLVVTFLVKVEQEVGLFDDFVEFDKKLLAGVETILKENGKTDSDASNDDWKVVKQKFPLREMGFVKASDILRYLDDMGDQSPKKYGTSQDPPHLVKFNRLSTGSETECQIRWFNLFFMRETFFKTMLRDCVSD